MGDFSDPHMTGGPYKLNPNRPSDRAQMHQYDAWLKAQQQQKESAIQLLHAAGAQSRGGGTLHPGNISDRPGLIVDGSGGITAFYRQTESMRQTREQIHQNSTRQARVTIQVETLGSGSLILPKPVPFDISFASEPSFLTGGGLAPGTRLYKTVFPLVMLGIYDWVTDDRTGQYVGCHLWASVYLTGDQADVTYMKGHGGYHLQHWLAVEGVAMKAIPDNVMVDLVSGAPPTGSGVSWDEKLM